MSTLARNAMRKCTENGNNSENMPPALASKSHAGKESMLSERRHFGRKQAFGELKNVLHNTGAPTPMKALKNQIFSPAPRKKTDNNVKNWEKSNVANDTSVSRKIRTVPNIDVLPSFDADFDLEYQWAERSARLAERSFARINSCIDDDDLLLPLPDVSSMESLESVFGKIEPISGDMFDGIPEPGASSLPSMDWDFDIFVKF